MVLYAIVSSLDTILNILVWIVLLRAIMSWFRPDPRSSGGEIYYRILNVLFQLTEPMLQPLRQLLPTGGMGIDLTPLILLLILQFLRQFIWSLL